MTTHFVGWTYAHDQERFGIEIQKYKAEQNIGLIVKLYYLGYRTEETVETIRTTYSVNEILQLCKKHAWTQGHAQCVLASIFLHLDI